ncbi:HTH-type transcriptional regulator CdhR [compost metagenome]
MQERFPETKVLPDSIFLRDNHIWTSAGVSAAIDLCLAFVEQDCGHEIALEVARELVVYFRRPVGQSQFSGELALNLSSSKIISDTQIWVLNNIKNKLPLETLANRCSMSVRNFRRTFYKETGLCPTHFIEKARLDKAKIALRDTNSPIKSIAYECGFPSDDQMRKSFKKHLSITPIEYRNRFTRNHD